MKEKTLFDMVQESIGYDFKNPDLICQAFTRRSYSEENGGECNEVLEFIGDKALDLAVIRILVRKFGKLSGYSAESANSSLREKDVFRYKGKGLCVCSKAFSCTCDEGELTKIKSRMVQKKNLAYRMEELGLSEYLLLGNSDVKNNVSNEPSVKEDLFEAIIGAVALDCGWDFNIIQSVVETMLKPEEFFENDRDDNFVRMIYDWVEQKNHCLPRFWFKEKPYTPIRYTKEKNLVYQNFSSDYDFSELKFHCELKLSNDFPIFCGFGASKSEARMNVCKLAYDWLFKNDFICGQSIQNEIENPNKNEAINQLETLARRGYFSIPTYDFKEGFDANGSSVWKCQCRIEEKKRSFDAISSSKRDAKKSAAFDMLMYVLGYEEEAE